MLTNLMKQKTLKRKRVFRAMMKIIISMKLVEPKMLTSNPETELKTRKMVLKIMEMIIIQKQLEIL